MAFNFFVSGNIIIICFSLFFNFYKTLFELKLDNCWKAKSQMFPNLFLKSFFFLHKKILE